MSHRASPTHAQGSGGYKRDAAAAAQRFVQFSPALPLSTSGSASPSSPHPFHAAHSNPSTFHPTNRLPYLDDPSYPHNPNPAPSDYHMEDLQDPFAAAQTGQPMQGGQADMGAFVDEDPAIGMRRIQTSPSSLYSQGEHGQYPMHPLLPTQPRTSINSPQPSLHQQQQLQVAYAGQHLQKRGKQDPNAAHSLSYEPGYYPSSASNPGTPQPQPMQATVVPARAVHPSGNSNGSLASLSPSSSSSSLSSLAGPSSRSPQSQQAQAMQAAAAAAMMEQGMRRIKSSPIALSSMVIPAVNVGSSTGSSKRQKTAGTGEGQAATAGRPSTQQKAQRRLARKAEAARASRRRKKAYVVGLEEKVAKLNAKLEALRHDQFATLRPVERLSAVEAVHKEEQAAIKARLLAVLQEVRQEQQMQPQHGGAHTPISTTESIASVTSPGSASDSGNATSSATSPIPRSSSAASDAPSRHEELKQLIDSFVTNSHKRQSSVDLYFTQLEKTLIPSVAVKFALWGLSQGDDFYLNDGLWQGVMGREVGLSAAQMAELLECRVDVTTSVNELHEVLQRMQALRSDVKAHMEERHKAIEDVIAVLSPQQLAAFCMWVESNPMCMQMLDTVWQTGAA